jgi:protein-L-isoaspartate O-methyltransferase
MRHIGRYLRAVNLVGLDPQPYSTVLNFGCGHPYTSELLSNFFGHVVAYDPSRFVLGQSDDRITYTAVLPPRQYDAVFMIEVIEHVPEPIKTLKALREWSKLLVVTTPIVPVTNLSPTNKHHQIEWSLGDFLKVIRSAGWELHKTEINEVTMTDGKTKGNGFFLLN